MTKRDDKENPVLHLVPSRIPWESLWPAPDPADGDGSEYAESAANDGTPGAVEARDGR